MALRCVFFDRSRMSVVGAVRPSLERQILLAVSVWIIDMCEFVREKNVEMPHLTSLKLGLTAGGWSTFVAVNG